MGHDDSVWAHKLSRRGLGLAALGVANEPGRVWVRPTPGCLRFPVRGAV